MRTARLILMTMALVLVFAAVAEARWYSPEMKRFISEDPMGYGAGDVNFYRYVGNSPANYTDPLGWYKVHYGENANIQQRARFELAVKVIKLLVVINPRAKAYFARFGIDIEEALQPGKGPDVYVEARDSDSYGRYNTLTNNICVYAPALDTGVFQIADTLIHESGHWANDMGSFFGHLNPPLEGIPSFSHRYLKKDGPYGYAAEIETLYFMFFRK